jgi:chromosome segregation ATPase
LAARVSELEEEHALELQSLQDAHAVAGEKIEDQNAARVAEAQAAMQQSVATMECEAATMAAKHDEEMAKLQARVEQGDAEVSRFRTAHARVAEEQSSAAAQLQAALAEIEALAEINKAALMKDKTALMQTHAEEIAQMETKWREELVQVEIKWRQRLAATESAGKAALRDREAKHAERVAALRNEFAAHNADVESALRTCGQNSWSPVSIRDTPQAHVVQKCALEVSAVRSELVTLRDMVVAFQSDWMKLLPRAKQRLVKKIRLLQQPTVAEPEPTPAMVYSPVSPMQLHCHLHAPQTNSIS